MTMMMIRIDTAELTQAVETLRAAAVEAADIGAGLWSCAECPMPAAVQGLVDKVVAAADQALDAAATQLGAQAVDLLNRAIIAQHDSLTAAGVTTPSGAPALIGGGGNYSNAISVEPSYGGSSAGLIGGGHYSAGIAVSVEPSVGFNAGLIGGGHYSRGIEVKMTPPPWGGSLTLGGGRITSAYDRLIERAWEGAPLNGGFRGGNLSIADVVMNGGNATRHILAPSWYSLELEAGGVLRESEVRDISEFTLY